MATIRFGVVPDTGSNVQATRNVSQANWDRMMSAYKAKLGLSTDQQVLNHFLGRIVREMIGGTKIQERNSAPVEDIQVT